MPQSSNLPLGAQAGPSVVGQWEPKFDLPNVAIHAHVLPNGKVLFWGRRDNPEDSLDAHECTPIIWDPQTGALISTPKPTMGDGATVNLFCAGHSFLPDGRLLVTGGHWMDTVGLNQACIYDYKDNSWIATTQMNEGRWYPTTTILPDGRALTFSGSHDYEVLMNGIPQVWYNNVWQCLAKFDGVPPLYPRMHVMSMGKVFISGPLAESHILDPESGGMWTKAGVRAEGNRDYAPSVIYSPGKIVYIGGGNCSPSGDPNPHQPTNAVESIDLNAEQLQWKVRAPMHFRRRQHNATVLPDGTVLVTGGTQGGGFNDLRQGQPVHEAELWDPDTDVWTKLGAEEVDRCYHSINLLLPDGRVLSAGGGEYRPNEIIDTILCRENNPKDSHRDAQIFSPPYLFKGARPEIGDAPKEVVYNETFTVETMQASEIYSVVWIRLPSVTHSFNQNQGISYLKFVAKAKSLEVKAPEDKYVCPPGHYMMFLLNQNKVPSVAKIIRVKADTEDLVPSVNQVATVTAPLVNHANIEALKTKAVDQSKGTHVVVGLTPTCPYGLSACWGGAYEGLEQMVGVDIVCPTPNAADCTADIYLADYILPDIKNWPEQFMHTANGSYGFRGVEVTVAGTVGQNGDELLLSMPKVAIPVLLQPLQAINKIQWDSMTHLTMPVEAIETFAYQELAAQYAAVHKKNFQVSVTGPLLSTEQGPVLQVRIFQS